MRSVCILIFNILVSLPACSQTFYFANNGRDDNAGTSMSAPWKSLDKLKDMTLKPGDSVLLERGSAFAGSLALRGHGDAARRIFVGAYGNGRKPVITGEIQVTGWQKSSADIWVAQCSGFRGAPGNLFINGVPQVPGRFPNKGYRTLTAVSESRALFRDSALTFPDHSWEGAEVVIRTRRWIIDRLPLASFAAGTFRLQQPASAILESGSGYFIQNHLATLDQNGEWYFEEETGRLYLYYDKNIEREHVTISVLNLGLDIKNSEHMDVDGLVFKNYRATGVNILRTNGISISHCEIVNSGADGMIVAGCREPRVSDNLIRNSNNNGIQWVDNVNGMLTGNTISRTGMIPGRGRNGNGNYIGMSVSAVNPVAGNTLIQYNTIDSTGYSGIDFRTGNTSVHNNVVTRFCLIKDDGGGIYTWNNRYGNNSIEGNIILHGAGSGEGTSDSTQATTSGIYIDDRSANLSITANTIAFCGTAGIYIHNATNIQVSGNTLFGNGSHLTNAEKAQLLIKTDAIVPLKSHTSLALDIRSNKFFSTTAGTVCVLLSSEHKDHMDSIGHFDANHYFASSIHDAISRFSHEPRDLCNAPELLTLADWQQETSLDKNSIFTLTDPGLAYSKKRNLVANSSFDTGTNEWTIWPDAGRIMHEKADLIEGPSLKVVAPPGLQVLLYDAGLQLDRGRTYRLSFSARSVDPSSFEFAPLSATPPWGALGKYACFRLDSTAKTFTYFFRPAKSSDNARLNFKGDGTFWVDNVTLYEVAGEGFIRDPASRLICNPSNQRVEITIPKGYVALKMNAGERTAIAGYGSAILVTSGVR